MPALAVSACILKSYHFYRYAGCHTHWQYCRVLSSVPRWFVAGHIPYIPELLGHHGNMRLWLLLSAVIILVCMCRCMRRLHLPSSTYTTFHHSTDPQFGYWQVCLFKWYPLIIDQLWHSHFNIIIVLRRSLRHTCDNWQTAKLLVPRNWH